MTANECSEIEPLIDREAHGWSEADKLRLDHHLGECVECREMLASVRFARDTLLDVPRLSDQAMERAVARAVARTGAIELIDVRKRRVMAASGVVACMALAAAVLLMVVRQPEPEVASTPDAKTLRSGAVASQAVPPQAPTVEPSWIDADKPEQRTFAHAQVKLDAGTRVRFDDAHKNLTLDHGRVAVDVDAAQHRAFRVTTAHFRVEVLGTRFVVTPETVTVEHGRVQVFDHSGEVLARELGAGASFSFTSSEGESEASGDTHDTQDVVEADAPEKHGATLSAHAWLARARDALAHGKTTSARASIARAEANDPSRADRAEASTLRAEAALLDRKPQEAVDLYQSVARRFPDLTAGENAAFAAAQLAARAEPAREATLLRAYVSRYPRGRFVDEARRKLKKLGAR